MIPEPILILSVVIGTLNLIERLLRRSNKYKNLLEKINKSKTKLIAMSEHQVSLYDSKISDEDLLIDALELIDEIGDLNFDMDFHIPS